MITGLLHLHSTMRYIILALLLITLVKAILNRKNSEFGFSAKLGLFTMIAMHIQLLFGLILLTNGRWNNFGDDIVRFIKMEHTSMMIIAVILGTLGHSLAKRATNVATKFKRQIIFFGITLVIVFGMIPWPFMRNFGDFYGWI